MAELRKDPIVDRWVVFAPDRAKRPLDYSDAPPARRDGPCPFCPGAESATPGEIFALRPEGSPADAPDWRLRVVPNKFPAFSAAVDSDRPGSEPLAASELFQTAPAAGAHELLIESRDHDATTGQFSDEHLAAILDVCRQRMLAWREERRWRQAILFKNFGPQAGATLHHPHMQLAALPQTPKTLAEQIAGAAKYFQRRGRCVFCELVEQERSLGERIVSNDDGFVVFCPFASRTAYETWIVPERHSANFEQIDSAAVAALARQLRRTLARLEQTLDPVAYNYLIQTAPFDSNASDHYHWHIEIIPRTTKLAGFEWASGWYVNPTLSETAAERLRATESR
jgi:UDPglucose--hexose-1-phosphate uridylyltransferase